MSDTAIFKITDGTTTIDLLDPKHGIGVTEWRPQTPPIIPTYQASPLSSGKALSSYKFDNATETIENNVSGIDQDDIIEQLQDARRLLIQGLNYHTVDWQDSLVYLIAKAKCETNTRYTLVQMAQMGEDDFPYGQPFASNAKQLMSEMSWIIERGNWQGSVPGVGECVEINSTQDWQYEEFWQVNTTLPVGIVKSLLQTANGYIYAGEFGQILRSTDNGASWGANTTLPVDFVASLLQTANGYIYAGELGQIWRSTDNGASWISNTTSMTNSVTSLLQTANGYIYAGELNAIWRSTDDGASWVSNHTVGFGSFGLVPSLIQTDDDYIYAGAGFEILRSIDNGASWAVNFTLPTSGPNLLQTTNGDIYAGNSTQILKSTDNGTSWSINTTLPSSATVALIQTANGDIYVADNAQILKSENNGESWGVDTTLPTVMGSLLAAANSDIYAGELGQILKAETVLATMGRGDTCTNEVYIANKQNIGNLTHIKIDDGGAFTDIFPISSYPQDLLPTVPVVNDALYFGQEDITNTGPFDSLVFDIAAVITYTSGYTIVWEYWNGAWATLTVTDNTDTGDVFRASGVNSVHWTQPSDWATTAVDSITGYWVRARLSALAGTITPPTQQNRDIYTIVNPFFEVTNTNILGDIQALAQFKIMNQCDKDGKNGSAPNLWANRILAGLRSTSRGGSFSSFVNISDEQNLAGIAVTVGANSTFGDDATTPTGRRLTYGALAGDTTFADRATITISTSIIKDFYGTFHLFLRGKQASGSSGDITTRVQIKTSSGGITYTTPEIAFLGTNDWELLDLDAITIPAGGRSIKPSDLGDEGTITIQAKNDSGATRDVYYYDLVFIPTDEWAGDFTDKADIDDSIIGKQNGFKHLIDIDSVTNPKVIGSSVIRQNDSNEKISAVYEFAANGHAMLQANATQRVYVLSAHIGSNDEWLSEPWVAWSVQAFKNEQYLSMRGSR